MDYCGNNWVVKENSMLKYLQRRMANSQFQIFQEEKPKREQKLSFAHFYFIKKCKGGKK